MESFRFAVGRENALSGGVLLLFLGRKGNGMPQEATANDDNEFIHLRRHGGKKRRRKKKKEKKHFDSRRRMEKKKKK